MKAVQGENIGGYFLRKRGSQHQTPGAHKSSQERDSTDKAKNRQGGLASGTLREPIGGGVYDSPHGDRLRASSPIPSPDPARRSSSAALTGAQESLKPEADNTSRVPLSAQHAVDAAEPQTPGSCNSDEVFSTPQAPVSEDNIAKQREVDSMLRNGNPGSASTEAYKLQQDALASHHSALHQADLDRAQTEADVRDVLAELEDAREGHGDVEALQDRLQLLEDELVEKDAKVQELVQQNEDLLQAARDRALQDSMARAVLQEALKTGREPKDAQEQAGTPQEGSLVQMVTSFTDMHISLKERFIEEAAQRRKLHNALVDLKGAIRVFCRVRPLHRHEADADAAVECDPSENAILISSGRIGGAAKGGGLSGAQKTSRFTFDAIFGPASTQEEVFAETAPIVASVLDGYNVCILAYGQTGSGKTWTMEGPNEDRGVNFRTLVELFRLAHSRQAECEFEINLSLTEVYMDQIRDLLADDPTARLEVKQGAQGSFLPGLTEAKIVGIEQAWAVLKKGERSRSSAATSMNQSSSRSHCLLCLRVRGRSKVSGDVWRGKLWLCDLAGSERLQKTAASGERLKEAQFINKSLSALGDCIHALATRAPHVPFRNSKLTYMLQDSLSGHGKTLMFVNVAPTEADAAETVCTLNFASRVRGLELGPAKRQVEAGAGAELRELRGELAALKVQNLAVEEERRQLSLQLSAQQAAAAELAQRLQVEQQARVQEAAKARETAVTQRSTLLSTRTLPCMDSSAMTPDQTGKTTKPWAPAGKKPSPPKINIISVAATPAQLVRQVQSAASTAFRMPPPSAIAERNRAANMRSAATLQRHIIPASVAKRSSAFSALPAPSSARIEQSMRLMHAHRAQASAKARKPSASLFPANPGAAQTSQPHRLALHTAPAAVGLDDAKENSAAAANSAPEADEQPANKADYMAKFEHYKKQRSGVEGGVRKLGRASLAAGPSRVQMVQKFPGRVSTMSQGALRNTIPERKSTFHF